MNIKRIKLIAIVSLLSLTIAGCGNTIESESASTGTYSSGGKNTLASTGYSGGATVSGFEDNSADYKSNSDYSEKSDAEYAEDEHYTDVDYEETDVEYEETDDNEVKSIQEEKEPSSEILLADEKLVYRCNMGIETLNYEETYNAIKELILKYNGRVTSEEFSNSNSYLRKDIYNYSGYNVTKTCDMTIRVPSVSYNDFVNSIGNSGNVISKNQSVDSITQEYYSNKTKLDSLISQKERYEDMRTSAATIEELIQVNDRISQIEYEITTLTNTIRLQDSDVAYSYVTLSIEEVQEFSEPDEPVKTNKFVDRLLNTIKYTWKDFLTVCENLLFAIIRLIPTIVILLIIFVIYKIFLSKKIKKAIENRSKSKDNVTLAMLLNYDEDNVITETSNKESEQDKNITNTEESKDEQK